jgi:hypothetical protein
VDVFLERSSFRGLCREVGKSGEDGGSFFTIIFGGAPFRDLQRSRYQSLTYRIHIKSYKFERTNLENSLLPTQTLDFRFLYVAQTDSASPKQICAALEERLKVLGGRYRHTTVCRGVPVTVPLRWQHS